MDLIVDCMGMKRFTSQSKTPNVLPQLEME